MTQTSDHTPLRQRVQASLDRQGMMQQLGVRLLAVAPGAVTLALPYSDRVTQQQGGFHILRAKRAKRRRRCRNSSSPKRRRTRKASRRLCRSRG